MRAPRGHFAFYVLTVTQTLSLIGSRMTTIAVGFWVFHHTGQATPLLLTEFFNELPGMLGGSVMGVLVDRWPRKRVLMLADAGQALGTLLLILAFITGQFHLWVLYGVALLNGGFAILQGPAQDATTTLLVPENQRERANAIKEIAFPLAGVIAPVLAGWLYTLMDVTGVMLVDIATFGVAISAVMFVHIPPTPPSPESHAARGNLWAEWHAGWGFLNARRPLLYLILYLTFINFLLNGPLSLSLPYLVLVTRDEALAGQLLGAMSAGALAGAVLIAGWGGTRPRLHTLLPGLLFTGAMILVYATARAPWSLGLALFCLMAPLPMLNALSMSILQLKTPPDLQGRIFGIIAQLGYLGSTTSFLLTGPLVDRILEPGLTRGETAPAWAWATQLVGRAPGAGMSLVLLGTGSLILISTLLVYATPAIRRLEKNLPDYAVTPV